MGHFESNLWALINWSIKAGQNKARITCTVWLIISKEKKTHAKFGLQGPRSVITFLYLLLAQESWVVSRWGAVHCSEAPSASHPIPLSLLRYMKSRCEGRQYKSGWNKSRSQKERKDTSVSITVHGQFFGKRQAYSNPMIISPEWLSSTGRSFLHWHLDLSRYLCTGI